MVFGSFVVAITLALFVSADAFQHVFKEHGKFATRDDWEQKTAANVDAIHKVTFAVKQRNFDVVHDLLMEVSNPLSPKYGKYLTREQVADLTANPEATEKIMKFLQDNGVNVEKKTLFGEYITASAPISVWNNFFGTTFYEYAHVDQRRSNVFRCLSYSLPQELADYVHTVFYTIQLPPRQAMQAFHSKLTKSDATAAATGTITPAVLNSYYHITSNKGSSQASQSLYESLGQYYSPSDLSAFQTKYNLPQETVAYNIGSQGPNDTACEQNSNNCGEANLDVQYIMAVSQVTPTTYWYDDSGDFTTWITTVADTTNPPLVQSMSYGSVEKESTNSSCQSFNTEASKLGLMGVTVVISSGDDGVANFQARTNSRQCGYNPSFPATSQYVLAVGATQGAESGGPEIACQSNKGGVITTGGGFSGYFPALSFQTANVTNYFNKVNPKPQSGYNANGRPYPDVSSAGFNYEVYIGGSIYGVSGTSASAPVTAGMISLVNAARLAAGKAPLGYVTQAVWMYGYMFANDVTSGENNCCAQEGINGAKTVCCTQGFYAAAGWDPLTGFGSIDYQKFYNVFYPM